MPFVTFETSLVILITITTRYYPLSQWDYAPVLRKAISQNLTDFRFCNTTTEFFRDMEFATKKKEALALGAYCALQGLH